MKLIRHRWQYNGVAAWDEIFHWCCHNIDWANWSTNHNETIWFFTDEDYSQFLLRWS